MAALLAATAVRTWREVHVRRERLEPQRAVNRLVLARASALVGALVAGAYLGYAISWIGADADLAGQRAWRSVAAAVGGVAMTIAAVRPGACVSRPLRPGRVLTSSYAFPHLPGPGGSPPPAQHPAHRRGGADRALRRSSSSAPSSAARGCS